MHLQEANFLSITTKQYVYKLKSYLGFSAGLIIAQLIAFFFSLNGAIQYGANGEGVAVSIKAYTADLAIAFTMIWIFIVTVTLTTKQYKNMEFTLVSNRKSSILSDVGIIITFCIIGGLSASLWGHVMRGIVFFSWSNNGLIDISKAPLSILLTAIISAILYMILVGAIGYLVGVLTQINRIFIFVIPVALIGITRANNSLNLNLIEFFIKEDSLFLFMLKVILTAFILFSLSILLFNKREVRV